MIYKALYRKYRPNNFDSVVGQNAIVKTLQNIVKEQKIGHAYLFSGPRGIGKTSLAKIFAKAINCLDPQDGLPCGKCSICKQAKEDQLSDIIEIDAASNNGVDEIRDLKSKINLVPALCKYKVYIIDEVHMLSIGAFNALLKTLEEPPHHVVFILATTELHKLPLTIISRCQTFNFKKITEDQMKIRLAYIAEQEKIKISDDALYQIARTSDGGMRDAIGLLEQLVSFTNNDININDVELLSSSASRKDINDIIDSVVDSNIEVLFKHIDNLYENGKDFTKIAEDIIIFLKDILLYKKAKNYFTANSNYNINEYSDLINKLDEPKTYKIIDEITSTLINLKTSSHPNIIFEITLLKLIDATVTSQAMDDEKSEVSVLEEMVTSTHASQNQHEENNDITIKTTEIKTKESTIEKVQVDKVQIEEKVFVKNTVIDELLPFKNIPPYKKILINNTLAIAEKKLLNELKGKCSQLSTFLINKDFKQAATTLLDGKIVGASNQSIIFTYPYDVMVEKADNISIEIEKLLNNIFGLQYRVINITDDNWQEIRPFYLNWMREHGKIDILPEIDNSQIKINTKSKKRSKEVDEAINMFGEDLIEIK